MKIYTKEALIERLREIRAMGWIPSGRHGNAGGVGNTLEDLLEIEENNLPLPNAGEWELKCQRRDSNSHLTLFHMEPSPRAIHFVPRVFLPKYGWKHKTLEEEQSFRQTISGHAHSDRGFRVVVDRQAKKVLISFDHRVVATHHEAWLESVKERAGLSELDPQPYWGFNDLRNKAGTKLLNCFYVLVDRQMRSGVEHFSYAEINVLSEFSFEGFLFAIENGKLFVDFDARTGHNHGTKFRIAQSSIPSLYQKVIPIT